MTAPALHRMTDVEREVYNLLTERGPLTTAEIIFLMSGHDEKDVRDAIRRMTRMEIIRRTDHYGPRRMWEVRP